MKYMSQDVKYTNAPTFDILLVHGRCAGWAIQQFSQPVCQGTVLYRLFFKVGG